VARAAAVALRLLLERDGAEFANEDGQRSTLTVPVQMRRGVVLHRVVAASRTVREQYP